MPILVVDHLKKEKNNMDLTNRAISSSFNQEITGSITRILVLGANDDEHSITRLEYGRMVTPESNFTPSSVTGPVKIPAGIYIEGPIARVKLGTTGGFLVYMS